VTEQLRTVLATGQETLTINNTLTGGTDPVPHVIKQISIVYVIHGQRKEKVLGENTTLNFKTDLK
jgi:hypothetical protein